jgi:CBS domain-containing protein
MKKTVEQLMATNLIIIEPNAPLKDGLKLMKEKGVKSIIVNKGRDGDAYGLLQYRDIAKSIISNEGDIELLNVYDVATKPVIQVSKQLESKYVGKLMLDYGIKRALVVDNNVLEGFISLTDVIGDIIDTALLED